MARRTGSQPGRPKLDETEKRQRVFALLRPSEINALDTMAKREGLSRARFLARLVEEAAGAEYTIISGLRGLWCGDIFYVANAAAKTVYGTTKLIDPKRDAAAERPGLTFDELIKFCAETVPQITVDHYRRTLRQTYLEAVANLGGEAPTTFSEVEKKCFFDRLKYYKI